MALRCGFGSIYLAEKNAKHIRNQNAVNSNSVACQMNKWLGKGTIQG